MLQWEMTTSVRGFGFFAYANKHSSDFQECLYGGVLEHTEHMTTGKVPAAAVIIRPATKERSRSNDHGKYSLDTTRNSVSSDGTIFNIA